MFQIDPEAANSNAQDSYSNQNHQYLNDYQLNEALPSNVYPGKNQRISLGGPRQDSDSKSKGGDSIHRSSKRGGAHGPQYDLDESAIANSDSYCLDPQKD